jgi:GR25 family glycosyltransferase involved in LPS biosynthesis
MSKKYLDGVDVIYWINLDRATDRKKKMEKLFQDPIFEGIKIIRISALDATKENPRLKFKLEELHDLNNLNRNRTDNEYAILYSHLNAIRTFSTTDYKNAIIFEDDLSLEYKKYWKKTIQEVMNNAPSDWEILKLNSFAGKIHTKLYTLWDAFKLKLPKHIRPENKKWLPEILSADFCANGYLIHNKSAKSLIKRLYHTKYKLNNTYPHTSDNLIFKELKTYIYKYPYFTYNDNNFSYNTKTPYYLDTYKRKITTTMYKKLNKTRKK